MFHESIKFQVNSSSQAFAGRKRKRVELEVGVAETPVANRSASCHDDENGANQIETKDEEHARIPGLNKIRNYLEEERQSDHVAENREHPIEDFALLILTFRAAR